MALAQSGFDTLEVDSESCPNISQSESKVIKNCAYYDNGDIVQLQGTRERYDLIVTNSENRNKAFYTPVGIHGAKQTKVNHGSIQIVTKNKERHAIIYRLDYKTKAGLEAFQIITVRTVGGRLASKQTCPVAVYDSVSSSLFKNMTGIEQEMAMRDKALEITKLAGFKRTRCLSN